MMEKKLFDLMAEIMGTDAGVIRPETLLDEELGMNSFDLFRILVRAEEMFDVELDEEKARDVHTAGELAELIQKEGAYGL